MPEKQPASEAAEDSAKTSKKPQRHRSFRQQIRHYRAKAKPILHKAVKAAANSSLPSVLLASSLLFARYLPNSDFSYPSEIILPIALFAALASVFFYVYRWTFKGRSNPTHVATFLLIYAVYGFDYAFPYVQKWTEAILPSSLTTAFSSAATRILLLGAIFWAVAYIIDLTVRRVKPLRQLQPYKVMLFAIVFIFAVQGIKVGARLWTVRHQLAFQHSANLPAKPADEPVNPTASTPATTESGTKPSKPNVYYILFDRYASPETLQNIYNYDNSPTLDYLADRGFVTRQNAYANYPFTQHSVASTLSMSYLSDLESRFKNDGGKMQTAFPYRNIISNPPVAQVFKQNGYQYNQVSSWWDFTRDGVKADYDPVKSFRLRIFGMSFWLTDLQRDIMHRSAFSPILQKGVTIGRWTVIKYDQDRNPRQNFADQMQALKDIAWGSASQQKPQFTFAHVLSPHDPYLFAADGSDAPYNGDRTDQDVDEYVKYTNQLTYANSQLRNTIGTIRKQDPNAVVFIQSDEGPYPKQFRGKLTENSYFDPKNLPDEQLRQKFGIMASYYMPGIDQSQVRSQLTNSVNVFPFILDNYLGYNIKYLPQCNFSAGNKFNLYDYALVTGRLQGSENPAECRQFDR